MNRVFEVWFGSQSSGKTYQLKRRARALAERKTIRRVIVVAPWGEWRDTADPTAIEDLEDDLQDWDRPRAPVVVRVDAEGLGDPIVLERIMRQACRYGDTAVIVDEGASWIPASWSTDTLRKSLPRTYDVILRGRHIERIDGEIRPTHLIVAAQYPRSVHHLVYGQASVIMVARPHGQHVKDFIRGHGDDHSLPRALALGQYQWTPIKGRDPRRG